MAVESRFVVIRNGVEVETFMDKKAADEYDKMLDMADNLSVMLSEAPIELSEAMTEDLSIFLAQHREEVLVALQAKKPRAAKPADSVADESTAQESTETSSAKPVKRSKATAKTKTESVSAAS